MVTSLPGCDTGVLAGGPTGPHSGNTPLYSVHCNTNAFDVYQEACVCVCVCEFVRVSVCVSQRHIGGLI